MSDFKRSNSMPELAGLSRQQVAMDNGLQRPSSCPKLAMELTQSEAAVQQDDLKRKKQEEGDRAIEEHNARIRARRNLRYNYLALLRTDFQITQFYRRLQEQAGIYLGPPRSACCMTFRQQKIFCAAAVVVNATLAVFVFIAWYLNW